MQYQFQCDKLNDWIDYQTDTEAVSGTKEDLAYSQRCYGTNLYTSLQCIFGQFHTALERNRAALSPALRTGLACMPRGPG
jgi:hypothetical protein